MLADDEYEVEHYEYLQIMPAPADLLGIGMTGYHDENRKWIDESCEYDVVGVALYRSRVDVRSRHNSHVVRSRKDEPRLAFVVMSDDHGIVPADAVNVLRFEFRDGRHYGERVHVNSRHEEERIKESSSRAVYTRNVIPPADPTYPFDQNP